MYHDGVHSPRGLYEDQQHLYDFLSGVKGMRERGAVTSLHTLVQYFAMIV